MAEQENTRLGFARDPADDVRAGVIALHVAAARVLDQHRGLRAAMDIDFMHQHIDAPGRLDQLRAIGGVAADREARLGSLEQKSESRAHRIVIDFYRRHHHLASAEDFTGFYFLHFCVERRRAGAFLMGDALLEFRLPQLQQSIDIALGALRPVHILRPVAALMPARNDELKQIDDMVGMKMGEKDGVDIGAAAAGG